MSEYIVNPDGTVTWDPGPDDYAYLRDEERDLLDAEE